MMMTIFISKTGIIQPTPGCLWNNPGCLQSTPGCLQPTPGCLWNNPRCLQSTPGCLQPTPGCLWNNPRCLQSTPGCLQPTPGCYGTTLDVFSPPLDVFSPPLDVYGTPLDVFSPPLDVFSPPLDVYGTTLDVFSPPLDVSILPPAESSIHLVDHNLALGLQTAPVHLLFFPAHHRLTCPIHHAWSQSSLASPQLSYAVRWLDEGVFEKFFRNAECSIFATPRCRHGWLLMTCWSWNTPILIYDLSIWRAATSHRGGLIHMPQILPDEEKFCWNFKTFVCLLEK